MNPLTRREAILGAAAMALGVSQSAQAAVNAAGAKSGTRLLNDALKALEQHRNSFTHHDKLGIADFSFASREPRFFLVDLVSGASRALLVAHGRGSDPDHSGWVKRFSNQPGSEATSAGTYLTGTTYYGKHGLSQRLIGLDPDNSNAEDRAIVIHAASYVSNTFVRQHGKLGRSQGCFAFDAADLSQVIDALGPGRMIYAGKA